MSLPSIPQIPTIPVGLGGTIQVPHINVPNVPALPYVPSITNMSGMSGLKALTGAVPSLAGGGNLCGISVKQIDVFATAELIKAALVGRVAAATILGVSGQTLLNKFEQFRQLSIQYTSFQAELMNLNYKDPVAVAAFLNRWKDKVPGGAAQYVNALSDALNKGLEYDYCQHVPNINIDPNTGIAKIFSKNAPTPSETPAESTSLTETVVDKFETPVSGVVPATAKSDMDSNVWLAYRTKIKVPMATQVLEDCTANSKVLMSNSSAWNSMSVKTNEQGKSEDELQDAGMLTQEENALFNQWKTTNRKKTLSVKYKDDVEDYFTFLCHAVGSIENGTAESDRYQKAIEDRRRAIADDKDIDDAGFRNYYTSCDSLVESNRSVIKAWYVLS